MADWRKLTRIISRLAPLAMPRVRLALAVFPAFCGVAGFAEEVAKPNVVLIIADDLGYGDLSCYGSRQPETPNIDRLAAQGARFASYYANSPWCSSSRAALLTGSYAHRISMPGGLWGHMPVGLNPDEITIAEVFKAANYATAFFGKWHLGEKKRFLPTQQGFDRFEGIAWSHGGYAPVFSQEQIVSPGHPNPERLTKEYTSRTVQFIRNHAKEPFFVLVSHPMPHLPIACSDEFRGKSRGGLYGDVIAELDWSVGEITNTLSELGIHENTLLIFTSDNGPMWGTYHGQPLGSSGPLRGRKGQIYEGGVRVPMIAHWPARIPAGIVSDAIVAAMDWLPTVAAIVGLELETAGKIDGLDISPLLKGDQPASQHDNYFYYNGAAIRHGDWKLIPGSKELFNLKDDLAETDNLYLQKSDIVERLKKLLDEHRQEVAEHSRPLGTLSY